MPLRKTISALLLLLLSFSSALPQSASQRQDTAGQTEKKQSDTEEKGLALLEKVVEQSRSLKLFENRIYIKATAASLLWSRDEKRARAVYAEVTDEIASVINSIENADEEQERVNILAQLRSTIIQELAPKDPELALSFLRATRLPPLSNYSYNGLTQEEQLEARLAYLIAVKDPKLSLQLARENLKKGFSHELIGLLQNLRSKDKESYNVLLKEILAKLQDVNFVTNQNASNLAFNLLSLMRSQESEAEAYRELLANLASWGAKASNRGLSENDRYAARNFLVYLRQYISEIEKYVPAQAIALRKKFAEIDEASDPYTKQMNALNQIAQNGTVDEILAATVKAPKEYRNQFYSQAMWKALGQGDFQRAIQITESDDISPSQRKQFLEQIDRQRIYKTINEGKIDEARQSLARVKNLHESIQLFIQLANNIASKGDKATALQILQEASNLVREQPKNSAEVNARLQLASAYKQHNPDMSFEMIAPLIPQLNDLVTAVSTLNGFENNYMKDGEFLINHFYSNVGNSVNQCHYQIAELARNDFDRAVSLGESFQREEVRLKALLLIAQTTLNSTNVTVIKNQKGVEIKQLLSFNDYV